MTSHKRISILFALAVVGALEYKTSFIFGSDDYICSQHDNFIHCIKPVGLVENLKDMVGFGSNFAFDP